MTNLDIFMLMFGLMMLDGLIILFLAIYVGKLKDRHDNRKKLIKLLLNLIDVLIVFFIMLMAVCLTLSFA